MEASTIVLVSIIVIMISVNYYIKNKDVVNVKSSMDSREYRIADTPDKQEVADLLASINQSTLKLIEYLKPNNRDDVKRLCKYYNPNRLGENLEYKSYKAYSLNKGEEIVLCVRDKDNNVIRDKNTILFVLIHELAHLMTKENGHPPIFWENMGYLLKESEKVGIYLPIDYSKNPVDYCGTLIDKTPYRF